MESASDISAELSAEFVLSHVIYNVCQFLKIKDLYAVAKVCKLWQEAAMHEMGRKGPEVKVMPFFDEPMIVNNDSKFSLLDVINTKPCVALLFFNRSHFKHASCNRVNLDYVINMYKQQLECNVIALDSEETYYDTNPRVSQEDFYDLNTKDNFGIPCLFLPIFKQSKLVISSCTKEDGVSSATLAQRMYKELISNHQDSRIILIMLAASQKGTNIARKMLDIVKKNHEQKTCSIWGNECYSLKEVGHNDDSSNRTTTEPTFIGIRLHGPSIDSWSFVIDASLKPDKFEEQLLKFKERIKFKRHSLGLTCGPDLVPSNDLFPNTELQDSKLFMNLVKKIFPEIPFIGEFSYEFYFHAYGCNSTSNVGGMVVNTLCVSLMIITHN